jgi:hypothetical protein
VGKGCEDFYVVPIQIVKKRIQKRLLNYIDENRLWLNGDSGFVSSFDATPNPHNSSFQKQVE